MIGCYLQGSTVISNSVVVNSVTKLQLVRVFKNFQSKYDQNIFDTMQYDTLKVKLVTAFGSTSVYLYGTVCSGFRCVSQSRLDRVL
jgi:hypothetical protein